MLDCVYASFLLDRVTIDEELQRALRLTKGAGIQLVLTWLTFPDAPGDIFYGLPKAEIHISIVASNEAIIEYLTKDAQTKKK